MITGRNHRLALRPDTLAEASGWIGASAGAGEALFDAVGEYLEERADQANRPRVMVRVSNGPSTPRRRRCSTPGRVEVMRRWWRWPRLGNSGGGGRSPGGREGSVLMRKSDGSEVEAGGEYTLIERPHRRDDVDLQRRSLGHAAADRARLLGVGGFDHVVMVNSGIATDERRDAQDYGWRGCFDELGRALAS